MLSQMACLRRGIVALVAFDCLFSTVNLKMGPQMAPMRGGIFTLVAFFSLPIMKVIFGMIHHFRQFDVSPFAASAQLTKKREIQF